MVVTGPSVGPRVVVIGAGIVGTSLCEELRRRGLTRLTLLDRGPLPRSGGSSSHAPGLVFATSPSPALTDLALRTIRRLKGLSSEQRLCFDPVGGLEVATTEERLADLHRRAGWIRGHGEQAEVLDAAGCLARHPLLDPDLVLGGLWTPHDGLAGAQAAVEVQLERIAGAGMDVRPGHRVVAVLSEGSRVTGVRAEGPDGPVEIGADVVVCAAGFWGAEVAALTGLALPLRPLGHQYVRTDEVPSLRATGGHAAAASLPILRHQGGDLYYRQHGSSLGIGYYGHDPIAVELDALAELTRDQPMPSMLPLTPEAFAPAWAESRRLLPALARAHLIEGFDGIFSFTPDGGPLLGPHPDLDGFWVAEAVWVTHSGGVAEVMAEWILTGAPESDLHGCELSRFAAAELAPEVVTAASERAFVEVYDLVHPREPALPARGPLPTPCHEIHLARGAVLAPVRGWQRPRWFTANDDLSALAHRSPDHLTLEPPTPEWARRFSSACVQAEALATRERVGIFDLTTLSRVVVSGPDAAAVLGSLLSRPVDRAVGTVVYALTLTPAGGVQSDVTVARLGAERFQLGVNGPGDVARWTAAVRRARADGSDVDLRETTTETCCLGVWGPAAPALVRPLLPADVDETGLGRYRCTGTVLSGPPGTAAIGVTLLGVSYAGEPGWEVYADAEDALSLATTLLAAGEPHGVVWAGSAALDVLRVEQGHRSYGTDLSAADSPTEAGLGFALGRHHDTPALRAARARPLRRRLRTIVAEQPGDAALGGELVRTTDGRAGRTTSAVFSPVLRRSVALAWLPADVAVGDPVTLDWFDTPTPWRVVPDRALDLTHPDVTGPDPADAGNPDPRNLDVAGPADVGVGVA